MYLDTQNVFCRGYLSRIDHPHRKTTNINIKVNCYMLMYLYRCVRHNNAPTWTFPTEFIHRKLQTLKYKNELQCT